MSNIVTVIQPVDANQHLEIASGDRSGIAYLLARLARDHLTPLVVVDGKEKMPACRFIAQVYGAGMVMPQPTARPT